jgi:hypothetical protein
MFDFGLTQTTVSEGQRALACHIGRQQGQDRSRSKGLQNDHLFYRALEMAAAPTEPGKSPFVTVTESDDSNLDSEVNHLQVEMLNIAEGYRCSIETDIREVGGAERVW